MILALQHLIFNNAYPFPDQKQQQDKLSFKTVFVFKRSYKSVTQCRLEYKHRVNDALNNSQGVSIG